jgi:hypothetical protein
MGARALHEVSDAGKALPAIRGCEDMQARKILIVASIGLAALLAASLLVCQIVVISAAHQISAIVQQDPTAQRAQNASKAFDAAQAAHGSGQLDRERLFLLNAVNQNPSDPKYISAYAESILHDADVSSEELDRARNVLELVVYQVPAEQVDPTLTLIDRISKEYEKSLSDSASTKSLVSVHEPDATIAAAKFASLKAVAPAIWVDDDKLSAQVDALQSLASDVADEPAGSSVNDLAVQVRAELLRWKTIQSVKAQSEYVDACLAQLDGGSVQPTPDMAVSVLQAADNALPQFWGERLDELPPALLEKVRAYPTTIANWSSRISTGRSKPILGEIRKTCEAALAQASKCGRHADACLLLEQRLKEINSLYAKITSPDVRADADSAIQKLTDSLRNHQKAQYNAYQKWALDKCDIAFADWYALHVYASAKNAADIYDKCQLYQIDPALLSPDVGHLYGDVLNKLFPNMDPPTQVAMWRKTQQQKWGLDQF